MVLSFAFAIWFGIVSYQAKRNYFVFALEGAALYVLINFIVSGFLKTQINDLLSINESGLLAILVSAIALLISVFLGDAILEKMRDKNLSAKAKKELLEKVQNNFKTN